MFTVTASDADSGLRLLHVTATQNGNTIDIVKKDLPAGTRDLTETFSLPKNVSNGAVTLAVTVKDASWHRLGHGNRADFKRDMTVDSKPPVVSVLSGQHNVNQGGTGLLVYSTDDAVMARRLKQAGATSVMPGLKVSTPPSHGRSATGTSTQPSARW